MFLEDKMEHHVYRPTEFELQIAVLYVIKNIRSIVDAQMISSCISSCLDANFFEVGDAAQKLSEADNITELKVEGKFGFSLTDKGEETVKYFYNSLPFSIREKLIFACEEINKKLKIEKQIVAEPVAIDDHTYMAHLEINESDKPMFKMDLTVGGYETARECCKIFKENSERVYQEIFRIMFEETDKGDEK